MRVRTMLSAAALAVSVIAIPMATAGTAQAAPGSDIDLIECEIIADDTDWGDGIDWSYFRFVIKNEGSAPTGDFTFLVNGVNGRDRFTGQIENEASVETRQKSLAPGQTRGGTFNITGNVVAKRTWGVFGDVNKETQESQLNDSFCSSFVNNT